jgi:hypothetical protein
MFHYKDVYHRGDLGLNFEVSLEIADSVVWPDVLPWNIDDDSNTVEQEVIVFDGKVIFVFEKGTPKQEVNRKVDGYFLRLSRKMKLEAV